MRHAFIVKDSSMKTGSKGDQLYVTTAHCGANGGDATRQEQFPDSGHLFVVDLSGQYRGVKRHHFGTK